MQKNILLALFIFLSSAALQANFLNLKISENQTVSDLILAFNEHLPAGQRISLSIVSSFTQASDLSDFLARILEECHVKLKPLATTVVQKINFALKTISSQQNRRRRAGGKPSCGSASLLETIPEEATTPEAPTRTYRTWEEVLNPALIPVATLSYEDLKRTIDPRLNGFFNMSSFLTYGMLILWIEKKCGISTDESAFNDLETLLKTLIINLKIFLKSERSKTINPEDLRTTQIIYNFLEKQKKHWDMWDLVAVQSAVDTILTFVKLPVESESPTAVTEL